MLAISPAVSEAITTALGSAEIPAGAGMRLSAGPATERGVAIEVTFVTAPDPSDQIIETDAPADVFVESRTAELLDDQILDAGQAPDGTIGFTLRPQGPSMDSDGSA